MSLWICTTCHALNPCTATMRCRCGGMLALAVIHPKVTLTESYRTRVHVTGTGTSTTTDTPVEGAPLDTAHGDPVQDEEPYG
mgnify:CR=1 FL=1